MTEQLYACAPDGKRRTWPLIIPLLVPVFFLGGQLAAVLPAKFSGLITRENVEVYPYILYFLVASFACAFGVLYLWVRYFEGRGVDSLGLGRGPGTPGKYARGFAGGIFMASVSVIGIWILGGYAIENPQNFATVSYGPILLLMLSFMIQSAVEEIFFRGWMLERLNARFGLWPAILANGAVFTLMHLEGETLSWPHTFIFITMTMCFSIFLSLLAVRQKSVWGAAAWHASWNWLYITWYGLPTTGIALDLKPLAIDLKDVDGAPQWLTGGVGGPEDSVVTMAVLIAGCALYEILRRRRLRQA